MHFPPKFLQKSPPPTFSMVHLLHRLYGVDAPAVEYRSTAISDDNDCREVQRLTTAAGELRTRWLPTAVCSGRVSTATISSLSTSASKFSTLLMPYCR